MIITNFGIILFETIERIKFIKPRLKPSVIVRYGIPYDRLRQRHPV